MADFFDDFGKKVSEVAEDLGKKIEDTVEVQKLKSKIRTLKRANERDFVEIGKAHYQKFVNGEVADMDHATLCEAIEKREEEVERHKETIQSIKNET